MTRDARRAAAECPAAAVSIMDLTIALPDGMRLFDGANLEVGAGEFVLLAGPSGAGKSTLLRLIAGLDDPERVGLRVSGEIRVSRAPNDNGRLPRVGIVFQDHALFDELSALDNVQFAVDHGATGASVAGAPGAETAGTRTPFRGADIHDAGSGTQEFRSESIELLPGKPISSASALLVGLGVEPQAKPATLSGGEKQRVAVARTLAFDPPLLLFDEPTTGLDPGRARRVADLIAQTHVRSGKTVVVVTHDPRPFLKHGPRYVFLDAATGTLREVGESELDRALHACDPDGAVQRPQHRSERRRIRPRWLDWAEGTGAAFLTLLQLAVVLPQGWARPKWKLRYLWHYVRLVALGTTAIYVAIAGIMLGFVLVSFTFAQLPYSDVTVPLLVEEFLAATGYSTFRVIVPLLIAVLVAGKCGASIAADVGTRRYAHQLDAMRNCGAEPDHLLYGNIGLALITGVPLLWLIGYAANWYASLVAFLSSYDAGTVALFRRNYFATLWPEGRWLPGGSAWVLLKMAGSGFVIAGLSYAIGARPKSSPVDVSRDVGLTIFWATLGVLLLHSIFAFIEF